MRRLLVALSTLIALAAVPACGGSTPTGPSNPPPTAAPTIACPSSQAAEVDLAPAAVTYPVPTVTGGATPVTQQCSIASGSLFPNGTSTVTCSVTDSQQRSAQCSFSVTVTIAPRLIGTKLLAFGDSITEGEIRDPVPGLGVQFLDPVNNYVKVLEGLLVARYTRQAPRVINAGISGEEVTRSEGRLVELLDRERPDAVLLMHGYNDAGNKAADVIAQSLRANVIRAQQRGVKKVFLATLAPPTTCRPGVVCNRRENETIDEVNALIRAAAARENAVLVDVYAALNPFRAQTIGEDGLHPTVLGHKLMAETFLAAIVANFEEPPPASATLLLARPGALGLSLPFAATATGRR